MKRFSFRLDTLLELRKRREEQVKLLLGKKNQQIAVAHSEMRTIHRDLVDLQSSEKEKRAHADNVLSLRYSVGYRFKLKQDLLKCGRKIDDFSSEAVGIRKRLVKTVQDRRAIEILRERKMEEWKKENRKREQEFIDDVSQQAYIRRGQLL